MPSKTEHVDWAKHNEEFWQSFDLDTTPFRDWVVTGLFYEMAHWVEAFLATKGHQSHTHGQRSTAMQKYRNPSELGPILVDYGILKQDSENARYECYTHTKDQVTQELIPLASNIRKHISSLL